MQVDECIRCYVYSIYTQLLPAVLHCGISLILADPSNIPSIAVRTLHARMHVLIHNTAAVVHAVLSLLLLPPLTTTVTAAVTATAQARSS
jgi:hypothetical protein